MSSEFEKKIRILKNRFQVVPLSKISDVNNPHYELSRGFQSRPFKDEKRKHASTSLESFMVGQKANDHELIWEAKDLNDSDNSRIYLVIDSEALMDADGNPIPQIAFYFGLSSGLVLNTPQQTYSQAEETLMSIYRDCLQIKNESKRSGYMNKLDVYARHIFEKEEDAAREKGEKVRESADRRLRRIKKIAQIQDTIIKDRKITGENDQQSMLGYSTASGIELTHFARNTAYHFPKEDYGFSLSEFVFWECIWDQIEIITQALGVRYMYLFAADVTHYNKEASEKKSDDIEETKRDINRLVSYYSQSFGFQPMEQYLLIKPPYDKNCISMFTSIERLRELRTLKWDGLNQ